MNHAGGEDWSAGNGTVLLSITALAEIPIIWSSEDTKRIVLDDSVSVEEITEIEVSGSNSNYYSNDYEDEEFIEGDDYF